MPHLTFEYTPNIQTDWRVLFGKLHPVLLELTGTPSIHNCKSRAYCCMDLFHVGDGSRNTSGFVHLEVAILEGKTKQEKQAIGHKLKDMIVEHLGDTAQGLPITIEVRDIIKDFYVKHLG